MEINCEFGVGSIFTMELDTCFIDEANITEKDHVIKEIKGIREERKHHEDVKCVEFYRTNVNYFPRGLEKHFPNLTQLVIHGCGIKEISKNDLKGLEGLTGLHIRNCQLEALPDDLFTEMPNIREVSFFGNKIEFASSELLKPLLGRENVSVNLRENKSINAQFEPEKCAISAFLSFLFGDSDPKSLEDLMKLIDEKCLKPTVLTVSVQDEFIVKLEERRSIVAGKIDYSESTEAVKMMETGDILCFPL